MKLRLFTLRNTQTKKLGSDCFPDKQKAKQARDEANKAQPGLYVVTPGPDHRKFKG